MKPKQQSRPMQAYRLMSKPVETVGTKDPLREVAHLFTEKSIGAAVVVDDHNKPIGIITKTDLARFELGDDEEDTVEHWMTPVIFTVKPETPIKEVAKRMVKYGVHHIFVRGTDGEPIVGVISSFDILRSVAAMEVDGHAGS